MKKFITLALSFLLLFTAVACSNKEQAQPESADKVADKTFFNTYTGLYDKSVGTLGGYNMYTDVDTANNAYKDKEYPGNEKYLSDVKAAYKDSKEKIQSFVDGLKNDAKTDDAELKKMNEDLIAEGEKLIKDIDGKIAKLDKITKNDYNKTQDEFIKLVDDTVRAGENVTNTFGDMLRNMNTKLGIDRKTIENNNTKNTTK
ncbi:MULTISPECIES: hypothetical protein [Terrisporobacter]|uniref:Lipoprotein n=1 Tax=Terrisporobacter muris TaxID=2963284 RepID=A0A9X2S4M5_9FIRM|nr:MULTISPECIES: hypothetical protein [Terrisporobacter]MCC3669437.1 hypothetical protein [Terrisporobacter mayombei]MCR1824372.1 hypothetical protein [Terrisporobacter muris]MDU6983533.1 hypothetical protein [Terrisporobacter othiniensis]